MARGLFRWLGRELLGPLIEALLPADCPGCRDPLPGIRRAGLCEACWEAIEPVVSPLCSRCGIGFATLVEDEHAGDRLCGRCLDRPPLFDGARCALVFEGPVRALLHLFKFDHRRDLARDFARAIVLALPAEERFDVIAPVPLHWTRRLMRGYNQAALLPRAIARATAAPFAPRLLVKRSRTPDQAGLDASARRQNLRGAFVVRRGLPVRRAVSHWTRFLPPPLNQLARERAAHHGGGAPLAGLRILLIDDVLTTGATAEECARTLKRAGASRVFVAAVARTPLTHGRG